MSVFMRWISQLGRGRGATVEPAHRQQAGTNYFVGAQLGGACLSPPPAREGKEREREDRIALSHLTARPQSLSRTSINDVYLCRLYTIDHPHNPPDQSPSHASQPTDTTRPRHQALAPRYLSKPPQASIIASTTANVIKVIVKSSQVRINARTHATDADYQARRASRPPL